MGGSGGGGFFYEKSTTPEDISKRIREAEKKTQDQAFEVDVADMIRSLLTIVNNRDTDTIQNHLSTIKNALNKDIDGTIDLRYGGSVSKHTYVDGISDIDSLAILNGSELIDLSPDEVKDYFYDRLTQRLPNSDISIGKLAITIKFRNGYEIQILPAIKHGNGIKIPSSRTPDEWSHLIKPKKFVETLRYVNMITSGKMVPVVKLAKSIISEFPEKRKLSGYHVEALAVEIFSSYNGEKTPKAMLKHFFNEASKRVLDTVKDKTKQTIHVDSYLGEPNSVERKMVADSLSTIARKMQNADGSGDIRIWSDILK